MGDLKEEVEKVSTGLSKAISDASEVVMERFKNPYITAFTLSWIAFNWKPIAFFVFSKGNVEYKINQISKHYSDINCYFYYPLVSAIIFLFFIPYLNQVNEWFLRFSIKKRADYVKVQIVDKINRETDIAIAENDKQRAIKLAREGEEHNDYVDKLNSVIKELNEELNLERIKNIEDIKRLQSQNKDLLDEIVEVSKNYSDQLDNVNHIISERDLVIKNQKDDNQILMKKNSDQQINYEKLKQEVLENSSQTIDSKQNEIVGLKKLIDLYSFMDDRRAAIIKKYGKFVNTKIVFFNGITIYEVFDHYGNMYYTQGDLNERYDLNKVKNYFDNIKVKLQFVVDQDLKTI